VVPGEFTGYFTAAAAAAGALIPHAHLGEVALTRAWALMQGRRTRHVSAK
jgi:hypothetical protein